MSRRLVGLFVVLLVSCTVVITLHVDRNRPLSVLDEFAYADYLHQIDEGRWVVRHGEVSTHDALRDLACRGVSPSTWNVRPPCDSPGFAPELFPTAGINSADMQPPPYFLLTYAGARAGRGLELQDDLLDAGRVFGAVW